MGPELTCEVVPCPEIFLHSILSYPSLRKGKTRGKYDRCNILQNELITWQSHREKRLAEEYLIKGGPATHMGGGKRSVSSLRRWSLALLPGPWGQQSPHSARSYSSVPGHVGVTIRKSSRCVYVLEDPHAHVQRHAPWDRCRHVSRKGKNTHTLIRSSPTPRLLQACVLGLGLELVVGVLHMNMQMEDSGSVATSLTGLSPLFTG